MGWFQRAIDRGVRSGVEDALGDFVREGGMKRVIEDVLWREMWNWLRPGRPLTHLGFIWALRIVFHRHVSREEAIAYANGTLAEYLADEKIKFGDPDYAWTRDAAEEIAHEYELRHWDRVA